MNRLRQRLFVRALEDRTVPAIFTVTNLNDFGADTLRQCVINANNAVGADTIQFKAGLAGTIFLMAGELPVTGTGALTITGPGPATLAVSGNNSGRIFNISTAAAGVAISVSGLSLTAANSAGDGGAIFGDDQNLTLTNCAFTFNKTTTLSGGAIAMTAGGTFKATNCVFNFNTAASFGGALYLLGSGTSATLLGCTITNCSGVSGGAVNMASTFGSLVIEDSVISGNQATTSDGGAVRLNTGNSVTIRRSTLSGNTAADSGGAIYFVRDGSLIVEGSTLSGNIANTANTQFGGGAIYFYDTASTFLVQNSTLSGNAAPNSNGGAVCLRYFHGTATFQNSTITGNTAGISGGGIARTTGTGNVTLSSTIVAGNSNANTPDLAFGAATSISGNNNLVGVANAGNFTLTGTGNLTGTLATPLNAKLAPLANNGGPTLTHTLATTSPCVNKGNNSLGLTTDQRGAGFARVVGAATDIGAVELATLIVDNLNDSGPSSLRQAVLDANAAAGTNTIQFSPALTGTITLISGEISISDSVSINGTGTSVLTISGNNASRIFNITAAPAAAAISIVNLTLTAASAGFLQVGGAIYGGDENLTLTDCALTASSAFRGGALHMSNGTLTATRCTFTGNSAGSTVGGSSSGGIDMIGGGSKAVIRSCTVSGNSALMHGGIYAAGYLNMSDTTVSDNSATSGFGGGIVARGTFAPGALTIRNCTISGNSANTDGGAVWFEGNATLVVQNSTITNNTAAGKGGGIHRAAYIANISLESTIVSGNSSATAPDISSAGTVNVKTSAVGSGTGFTKTDQGGNLPFQAHANLKLGPLANNGGPTLTHYPASVSSPLIDKGSNPAAAITDQRGAGFPRVLGATTDIGATEFDFSAAMLVTNINDAGPGSLREAIGSANSLLGANTVTFDPTVFATPQTIALTTGEVAITDSVTIISPPAKLTIDAGAKSRHFNIDGAGTLAVSISGLSLINGTSGTGDGGSVRIDDEVVVLSNMSFTGNKAEGTTGDGGAITIASATFDVTMQDCTISGNSATSSAGQGGGINVDNTTGKLTMLRCIVSGNTAGNNGGGIYFFGGGTLVMDDSTVSGNTANKLKADDGGGGIYLFLTTATIRNCTISGNSASNGGGIGIFGGGASVIQNSTIAFNKASNVGGGITRNNTANVTLESTIVSNNTAPTGPDVNGTIGTMNTSLVSSSIGLAFTAGTGNLLDVDGKLGPLTDNGGPTQTHALLSGSPAINAGSNPAGLANDQRGSGFARTVGQTDIGAFEVQSAPAKVTNVQINDGSAQRSRVTSVTINFDSVVSFSGPVASAFQLKRQSDNASPNFTATAMNGTVTSVTLTSLNGTGTDFGSLADGRYTLTVLASQINNFDGNGDGTPGDNFVLTGDPATNKLFRLFGDADGDGTVAANDFIQFRLALGGSTALFDFDGDGAVAASDFIQFRLRFGGSI